MEGLLPATAGDERKQLFMSSGLIIKTTQVTHSAKGDKNGLWTQWSQQQYFYHQRQFSRRALPLRINE